MLRYKTFVYSAFFLLLGFMLGLLLTAAVTLNKQYTAELQPSKHSINETTRYSHPQQRDFSKKASNTVESTYNTVFKEFLRLSKYDEAMVVYNSVSDLEEEQEAAILKKSFISHISDLLQQQPFDDQRIEYATDQYLSSAYTDIQVILLKAQLKIKLSYLEETIETYNLAYSFAHTDSDKQIITSHYDQFARNFYQTLTSSEQWHELVDMVNLAERLSTITDQDRYLKAFAYIQINEPYLAMQEASYLSEGSDHKKEITSLLDSYSNTKPNEVSSNSQSSIKLEKYGHQFLVPLSFSNNDSLLLLDTGASITTLSKEYFNSINSSSILQYKETKLFSTANGKTNGDIYTLDKLTIGDYQLENIDIAVLNFSGGKSKGLLGMNVLRLFEFSIDQKNSILNLSKK